MSFDRKTTRRTLADHRLSPHKKFGQNFLVHRHTAEAIVRASSIDKKETVIEVGVGLGALTQPLAAAAKHVLGFEIDNGIIRYHQAQQDLPDNVTLIHQDILVADFTELFDRCRNKLHIVANLPYSITNPFLFKLIDHAEFVRRATIMVQKEVADRLLATSGTKNYGVPTVLMASRARVKKLLNLGPDEFHPRPKVDSTVIGIDFDPAYRLVFDAPDCPFEFFKRVVRTAFNQRRKTIHNSMNVPHLLPAGLSRSEGKDCISSVLVAANISPTRRPETLELEDFALLTRELWHLLNRCR